VKLAVPAVLLAILAALVAGCGGGGTTTVIERTVTVETGGSGGGASAAGASDSGGASRGGGAKQTAAEEKSVEEKAEEAAEPKRIVHLQTFRSPSGNIGCVMLEGGARCDIRKRDWSPPPRPARCPKQVGYGQGVEVSQQGEATFVCAGDTALDPSASSLSYGTASEVGGSECISRENGVTCVNQAGHGFFLSIQSYQVF
jgi:hypothetical protein